MNKLLHLMLTTAGLLFVLLLPCGCATTMMKGTPFFSGEYANAKGLAEDRVNLWPLAYYNDPALSVLWPMGEHTDTSLAFRPLFSLYRDTPGEPYSELNVLWPLSHFSLRGDGGSYILPVYWDDHCTIVFPLYWSGENFNGLFPLWLYDANPYYNALGGYDLHLLWPLYNSWRNNNTGDHGLSIFPLFYHKQKNDRTTTWALAGLGGATKSGDTSSHWLLPLYTYDGGDKSFYSLAYSRFDDTTLIPPLLSWWDKEPEGATDFYSLLGLFHQRYNAPDGKGAGHLFPLYAYDNADHTFYSPAYAHWGNTTLIPPLLTWRNDTPSLGRKDLYALGGLFHNRTATRDNDTRSWLMPLYYSDTRNFISPLWARGVDSEGRTTWSVIPPLISWHDTDPATEAKDFYSLAGLFRQRYNVPDDQRAGHLLPLYLYDNARGTFLSLLYTRYRDTTLIPPLLSWQTTDPGAGPGAGAKDLSVLGGLFHQRYNTSDGKGSGHLFPLYAYDRDHNYLYTPLYLRDTFTTAIPPLLSWQDTDPATGVKDFYTLAGLFHQRYNTPDGKGAGYLLPLYAYDNAGESFYTLLYGHSRNMRYYFTPIIGSQKTEHDRSFWFLPFLWHDTTNQKITGNPLDILRESQAPPPMYFSDTFILLGLAGASHSQRVRAPYRVRSGGTDEYRVVSDYGYNEKTFSYCFPLWRASREKVMTFSEDLTAVQRDTLEERNALLFFLYDTKRESSQTAERDYVRRRVLWRLMHYEKLNGDVSLDIFPAITWDAKADGARKVSFLWRFFRYERPADGPANLDLLFLPILR